MIQQIDIGDDLGGKLADAIDFHGGFANWPDYPAGASVECNLITEEDDNGDTIFAGIIFSNANMEAMGD